MEEESLISYFDFWFAWDLSHLSLDFNCDIRYNNCLSALLSVSHHYNEDNDIIYFIDV